MRVRSLRTLALITFAVTLGACGNRTPLTLPKPAATAPKSAPATAPESAPAQNEAR